jgi:hypothetical protein
MKNCHKKRNKIYQLCLVSVCVFGTLSDVIGEASKNLKLEVKLSPNVCGQQVAKYRIMITNHPAAFGEVQAVQRLTKAASNLGWEWAIVECLDK